VISEEIFRKFITDECSADASHDINHIERVVKTAGKISAEEGADSEIVITAAWLHDCVMLPKKHPERKTASKLAAEKAVTFLKETSFPSNKLTAVHHAIVAHSFSAGIEPETLEAKTVQDADRLDALGAIGIARCFMVGGDLDRPLYNPEDPFCETRNPDDSVWTIDHFYKKLFLLPELLHTESAKKEAETRIRFMKSFLKQLKHEISDL